MRNSWIAIAIVGLAASSAAAGVYKWTDANGVTQYSEFPPAQGDAKEIRIAPTPEAPAPADESAGEAQAPEEAGPITEADLHARFPRSKGVQCAQVRETIRVLQIRGPVWRVNEAGEEVLLTNEEREAEMKTALEREPKYCGPPGS